MCYKTEYTCHLEGMLDRDLRTTKTPVYSNTEEVRGKFGFLKKMTRFFAARSIEIFSQHFCHPSRTKSTSHFKWRKGYSLHSYFKNLQNVLILVVYLTLVCIPTVRSAPAYSMDAAPKWANPCGVSEDETDSGSGHISNPIDSEFLDIVLSSIASALNKANEFKDNYSQKTFFDKPFDRAVIEVTPDKTKYEWLVKLPNEYVNKATEIPPEELQNLKIDVALKDAFLKVQTIAVALERTVKNQDKNSGKFKKEFDNAYHYLRNVLCELKTAMSECSIPPPPNVSSDIIPKEFEHLDKTQSGPFDFFVLRECIKTLNYINKIFEYLKKNSQKK